MQKYFLCIDVDIVSYQEVLAVVKTKVIGKSKVCWTGTQKMNGRREGQNSYVDINAQNVYLFKTDWICYFKLLFTVQFDCQLSYLNVFPS